MRVYRQSPSFWPSTANWFWSMKFVSPSKSIKPIQWDSFSHWAVIALVIGKLPIIMFSRMLQPTFLIKSIWNPLFFVFGKRVSFRFYFRSILLFDYQMISYLVYKVIEALPSYHNLFWRQEETVFLFYDLCPCKKSHLKKIHDMQNCGNC